MARLALEDHLMPTPESAFDEWRSWSLERLETEYSPSSRVRDFPALIRSYGVRSRRVVRCATKGTGQSLVPVGRTLGWGDGPNEVFEYFASGTRNSPLLVFIHGGYWQEGSRADSLFAAPRALAAGISYAAIEYDLAPSASLEKIVDQCRRALRWLLDHASALGFDRDRVHVAGSSAGAHLTAMLLLRDYAGGGAPDSPPPLAGAVLLSGVYDLRPLVPTYINRALGLSDDTAAALSPLLRLHGGPVPIIVAWGEAETAESQRQSRAYAAVLRKAGFPTQDFEVPRVNHFDIVFKLADPRSSLGQAVLTQIRGGPALAGAAS